MGVDLGKQEGGFLLDALNGVGAGDPHAVHPPRVIRSVIARGTLISHLFCPSPRGTLPARDRSRCGSGEV